MKLEQLKEKLEKKGYKKERRIRKEYQKEENKQKKKEGGKKGLKIIGITGSKGKSTVALMIHDYLKEEGYKSVLYSSVMVDSPASFHKKEEAYEVAVKSEEELLRILEEVEAYDTEFLVLEVNESTIKKGILKEVEFDVRVLTNLNPKHNEEQYSEKEYVEIKKSFFKDIEEECKCVIGFQDYEKELLDEILKLNKSEKYISTSNYIAKVKGLNPEEATSLLYDLKTDIDGMELKFKLGGKTYQLKTKQTMPYNALNILTAITTLEALGVLNVERFEKAINELVIPGRAEVTKVNKRLIVVDTHLPAMLECLKTLKEQGKVDKIKVVIGSIGYGYKYWEERFKTENFRKERKKKRKYAMELLKGVVDYVYLTESDSGKEKAVDICEEMKTYLNDEVPSTIVVDREQAIKRAIMESNEKDAIFISGRGNRRVLCNSEETMKLVKDSEVVEKVVKELGW